MAPLSTAQPRPRCNRMTLDAPRCIHLEIRTTLSARASQSISMYKIQKRITLTCLPAQLWQAKDNLHLRPYYHPNVRYSILIIMLLHDIYISALSLQSQYQSLDWMFHCQTRTRAKRRNQSLNLVVRPRDQPLNCSWWPLIYNQWLQLILRFIQKCPTHDEVNLPCLQGL